MLTSLKFRKTIRFKRYQTFFFFIEAKSLTSGASGLMQVKYANASSLMLMKSKLIFENSKKFV